MTDLKRSIRVAAGLLVLSSASSVAVAETTYVPLQFRITSGVRPYVQVRMDGKPFLMMVHANAHFTMMTTHANAKSAGVADAVHMDRYGITKVGHLSDLGRERAVLPLLQVGDRSMKNEPILVFEIPQEPPVDGMLGSRWLRSERVILDYDRERLGLPETEADSAAEDRRLVAEGYVPHKLAYDPVSDDYVIEGSVDGTATPMAISTVAENVIDSVFAEKAKVPVGPVIDAYGGPAGSLGEAHVAKREIDLVVDGQEVVAGRPQIFDTYDYDSEKRAPNPDPNHIVKLGADFLLANQAVIDFGTGMLFLRPLSATAPARARAGVGASPATG